MELPTSAALADETCRLAALHALALLNTPPDGDFDAVARRAQAATGCPTALVNLVDRDRLWVKASVGDAPCEIARDIAFCDTVIVEDAPLIVENLAEDCRFTANPLVAAGVRFYAGLPIRVADAKGVRRPVGTVCVLDTRPRMLTATERAALDDLAQLTEALLAARALGREAARMAVARDAQAQALERQHALFRQAERMARIGWWRLTLADERVEWSEGVARIHDLPPDQAPSLASGLDFYPPAARAAVSTALTRTIETSEPFDVEVDFVSAAGRECRVRVMGDVEHVDGRAHALLGVFRDVTEEHNLAEALRRSADTDHLTLIANRAAFERRLDAAIAAGPPLALAMIDLDGFKRVNDTLGHLAGDDVLKAVARRLHAPWLRGSVAARLGGDEFAVIIEDPALLADETTLMDRIEHELCVSITVSGLTMETGGSVGLAFYDPQNHASPRALVQAADELLYVAKRRRVGERRRG